jgi:hypothetical protein
MLLAFPPRSAVSYFPSICRQTRWWFETDNGPSMHFWYDFSGYISIQFDVGPQIHLLWPGRISFRSFAHWNSSYEFIISSPDSRSSESSCTQVRIVSRQSCTSTGRTSSNFGTIGIAYKWPHGDEQYNCTLRVQMINPTIILSMVEVYKYSNFHRPSDQSTGHPPSKGGHAPRMIDRCTNAK